MKKIDDLISISSLKELAHRMAGLRAEHSGANVAWRLFLGVNIAILAVVAVMAWFVYGNVIAEPSALATFKARDRQAAFSIEDLRKVIALYQQKEDDFNTLHSSVPAAPELHKGSGVSEPVIPLEQVKDTEPLL
jgi:hypothetical protein